MKGSKARAIYGSDLIRERHRHRYEVNNRYLDALRQAGLSIGGWSADDTLVEVVELPEHPWFVACQFHLNLPPPPRRPPLVHQLYPGRRSPQRGQCMSATPVIKVGALPVANHLPMVLFGGMNVLESRDMALRVAEHYVTVTQNWAFPTSLRPPLIRPIAPLSTPTEALAWMRA